MDFERSVQVFEDLGLSRLEAEIYLYLVQNAPATGYRVAKGLNRPNSNTYKSIETLASMGMLLAEDAHRRQWRAIPVKDLLDRMERRFQERKIWAEKNIRPHEPVETDDRIYHLTTTDQVFERAEWMLERSKRDAFIAPFPKVYTRLCEPIRRAISCGIKVALLVYEPTQMPGAQVALHKDARSLLERRPGQWLTMATDASQWLLATIAPDGDTVQQGVWTANPMVARAYHHCAHSEFLISAMLADPAAHHPAPALYDRWIHKLPYPRENPTRAE
ncbi:MAG: hypothetical protein KJ970_05815 [Candidatus Eisenbacteria bacterium]|uniref:Transcription regulator TrmB N-terminal domain-containing protein n=1 Tax=Eiseniibacteriota bacterium TaxID=2212470 RepID=A0A948RTU0_UNCEI|nr:hypothetical protein [Candidatus Eisenbacteria bacterium]MBU1949353.1 hypothetical protein [Candidatus Eisenbacteria bacterium]MBU2690426.1 hypothetical protein [Candidatus Eisenbacteria bacterium]